MSPPHTTTTKSTEQSLKQRSPTSSPGPGGNMKNTSEDENTVDNNERFSSNLRKIVPEMAIRSIEKEDEWRTATLRCELEDFTRFSECHLWKLMMSFYDQQGVQSWAQGIVPHFITCNAFIGRQYAHLFQAYIRDCTKKTSVMPLDPEKPLYIIELGAGSGKFSHFFMRSLLQMKDTLDFPLANVKYIMTDFTRENLKYWENHPSLVEHVKSGLVDFAIFDATNDHAIYLEHSKITLSPGSVANPICVVANYLFDTLYHDLFRVHKGVLMEGLVSVGSQQSAEPDPLDPEIIKRLSNKYKYVPIETEYYTNEEGDEVYLNQMLKWYKEHYSKVDEGATFLVPLGALRALRRLTALSSKRAMIISGDKGHNNPEYFQGLLDPHIAVHGSFSVMVNYHAVGIYIAGQGGFALHNPQDEASLKVSTFILNGVHATSIEDLLNDRLDTVNDKRLSQFTYTKSNFEADIVAFGPNDLFVMQKSLKEDAPKPSLKGVGALLKLSNWDSDVFYKFRETILDQIPTCGIKLRNDMCRGIPSIWANYYFLDKDKDIAFEIGRFYYGIRQFDDALRFYTISSETIGEHHVTCHNMGLCHYSRKNLEEAKRMFEKASTMNTSYEKAKTWLERVTKELQPSTSQTEEIEMNLKGQKVYLCDPESTPNEEAATSLA